MWIVIVAVGVVVIGLAAPSRSAGWVSCRREVPRRGRSPTTPRRPEGPDAADARRDGPVDADLQAFLAEAGPAQTACSMATRREVVDEYLERPSRDGRPPSRRSVPAVFDVARR